MVGDGKILQFFVISDVLVDFLTSKLTVDSLMFMKTSVFVLRCSFTTNKKIQE